MKIYLGSPITHQCCGQKMRLTFSWYFYLVCDRCGAKIEDMEVTDEPDPTRPEYISPPWIPKERRSDQCVPTASVTNAENGNLKRAVLFAGRVENVWRRNGTHGKPLTAA